MTLKIEIGFKKYGQQIVQDVLSKFNIWYLLLISFALHLFSISFPSDGMIFDEAYYVPASVNALHLVASNTEQMPLAKIMGGISIGIFGNYWFAWRIPIVLCAIVALYAFYLIAKRFMPEKYALFAATILLFDIMFFVHGSVFVLDMPSICFGLVGIYLYLTKKHKWSALSLGISILMYATGALFALAVLIYHITTHLNLKKYSSKLNWKKFASFLIILTLTVGGGLWLYDVVYHPSSATTVYQSVGVNKIIDQNGNMVTTQTSTQNITESTLITNPIQNILFEWRYMTGLSLALNTSATQYRPPWSWILPIGNSLNPPHYFTVSVSSGGKSITPIDWVSQITPFVEYMLIPIAIIALVMIVRKKDKSNTGLFLLSWMLATYVPWVILGIRGYPNWTNFNYYMLDTIPMCALGIPYFWGTLIKDDKTRWAIMLIQLTLTMAFFMYYFPVKLIQ